MISELMTGLLQQHPFCQGFWRDIFHDGDFDGARLRHACERDYAFGFALMRAILTVMAERLHSIRVQLLDKYTPVGAGNQVWWGRRCRLPSPLTGVFSQEERQ